MSHHPDDSTPAGTAGYALSTVVIAHVAVGSIGLFGVFLFVYGFSDSISFSMHVAFLVGTAVVASLSALVAGAAVLAMGRRWSLALAIGGWSSLFAYGTAVALGTVVSLLNEHQNSVTADQENWPFVLVVAIGIVAAAVGARRLAGALQEPPA